MGKSVVKVFFDTGTKCGAVKPKENDSGCCLCS